MRSPRAALAALGLAWALPGGAARAEAFDLVLAGGRVMDPESGLDAVRNVGIRTGRIEAVAVEAARPSRARASPRRASCTCS